MRCSIRKPLVALLAMIVVACHGKHGPPQRATAATSEVGSGLRTVAELDRIADRGERSRALFMEASRVLLDRRCVNCHPDGDTPDQGPALARHDPPVIRGPENRGVPGNECTTCHQDRNQELARVPGAPNWHLAPIEMAWVGKSASYICHQIQDPKRNGGKSLAQIVDHSAHDPLVAWAWAPGQDREPAPGTQAQFGALIAAWVETGAQCPEEQP
jgi:hypothetical protein